MLMSAELATANMVMKPKISTGKEGVPDVPLGEIFPFMTVFAVANTALINMLMASRLIYGMARQDVLPRPLAKVLPGRRSPWSAIAFTTLLALGLMIVVSQLAESSVTALSGTTALLLLCVFAVVNVAVLVLRREPSDHEHYRTPTALPVLGVITCVVLASPFVGREGSVYLTTGILLAIGVVLWLVNRAFVGKSDEADAERMARAE